MDIKFAPKDSKIIKANPGRSPYELLELGISQAAFDKLMAQPTTDVNPLADETETLPPTGATETVLPTEEAEDVEPAEEKKEPNVIIPKLTGVIEPHATPRVPRPATILSGQVIVQTPEGVRNPMGREFAQKLIKLDPRYKIIG